MAIERISIENFTVFDKIEIDFCKGVNIFIGENGTGKTTLLKLLYAWCNVDVNEHSEFLTRSIKNFNDLKLSEQLIQALKNSDHTDSWYREIIKLYSVGAFSNFTDVVFESYPFGEEYLLGIEPSFNQFKEKQKIPSIFIPPSEMLSHTKGFPEHYEEYDIPFDDTQIDIIKKARLNATRELKPLAKKLLSTVSKIIDGEVLYENDTFYIVKNNGAKIPFSMEAEGFRKFGLLWKLLRNGLFDKAGTVLLWDEPEANLNPTLIPVLVDILLELSRGGVQIFLATHDSNLVQYFDTKKANKEDVMFHSLYKGEDKQIYCESSHTYHELENKAIEEADAELGNFIIQKAIEELDNL